MAKNKPTAPKQSAAEQEAQAALDSAKEATAVSLCAVLEAWRDRRADVSTLDVARCIVACREHIN